MNVNVCLSLMASAVDQHSEKCIRLDRLELLITLRGIQPAENMKGFICASTKHKKPPLSLTSQQSVLRFPVSIVFVYFQGL